MPEFITDGALLQCDKGVAPSKLTVTSQQGCMIAGKPQATIKDKAPNTNIAPFGVCSVTQKSCVPQPTAWLKAGPYTIDGVQELTTDSFCMCGMGGKMQFLQSGNSGFVKLKDPSTDSHDAKKDDEKDKPTPVDFLVNFALAVDKPEDFKNEFGFDYMRPEYENIIQSDYEALKAEYRVCNNAESYVLSKPYYTPWLAMFKDHKKITGYEVKLKLHTKQLDETPNDEVDVIKFACPTGIEIYDEGGNTKIEKLKYSEIEGKIIQIKCTQSFSEHQYITVVHAETKHSLGFLNLYKNNSTYQLPVRIVKVKFEGKFITKDDLFYIDFDEDYFKVEMETENGILRNEGSLDMRSNLKGLLHFVKENETKTKKLFLQALIEYGSPNIIYDDIDINFSTNYFSRPNYMKDLKGVKEMKDSIKKQAGADLECGFYKFLQGLKEYYISLKGDQPGVTIFLLPINLVPQRDSDNDKISTDDGYSDEYTAAGRYIMLPFPKNVTRMRDSTIVHEAAHTLGLTHSFQSKVFDKETNSEAIPSKHIFTQNSTDNVMDYSANTKSFWKWQWEEMHKDNNDLIKKPS